MFGLPEDFPFCIHFYKFGSDCRLIPSFHDYHEIIYIFEGKGSIFIENSKYKLHQNDILIINSNELHRLETAAEEKIKVISVYFNPGLVAQPQKNNLDFDYLIPFSYSERNFNRQISENDKVSNEVFALITKMENEWRNKEKHFKLAVKNNLLEILLILLRHYQIEDSIDGTEIPMHHFNLYKEVLTYISKNYHKKIGNTHCANLMNVSTSYFCRLFKKITGMPLTEYVHRYRIEKSKQLLIKHELSISQIAYETGFENLSYYDRLFQRYVKMSPKAYQEYFRKDERSK